MTRGLVARVVWVLVVAGGCASTAPEAAEPATARPPAVASRPGFLPGEVPRPVPIALVNASFTLPMSFVAKPLEGSDDVLRFARRRAADPRFPRAEAALAIERMLPLRDPAGRQTCADLERALSRARNVGVRERRVQTMPGGLAACLFALEASDRGYLVTHLYSSSASWRFSCRYDPHDDGERGDCATALASWQFSDPPADALHCADAAQHYSEVAAGEGRTLDPALLAPRCRSMGLDTVAKLCWGQARSMADIGACDMAFTERRYDQSQRRRR